MHYLQFAPNSRLIPCSYVALLKMNWGKLILNPQILTTRLAARVEVWSLTNTHSAVPAALTNALVVECRRVEDTAVIPDR
jgi:hypothetical protein